MSARVLCRHIAVVVSPADDLAHGVCGDIRSHVDQPE